MAKRKPPAPVTPEVESIRLRIQGYLAEANECLDRAKEVADEHQESFVFLERTYYPRKVVVTVTEGSWENPSHWDTSDY